MKKRKKRKCKVRHVIICRSKKRRTKARKGRKSSVRRKGRKGGRRGGGSYAKFMKAMWRKHRSKLMKMTFKQRSKWVSSQYRKK